MGFSLWDLDTCSETQRRVHQKVCPPQLLFSIYLLTTCTMHYLPSPEQPMGISDLSRRSQFMRLFPERPGVPVLLCPVLSRSIPFYPVLLYPVLSRPTRCLATAPKSRVGGENKENILPRAFRSAQRPEASCVENQIKKKKPQHGRSRDRGRGAKAGRLRRVREVRGRRRVPGDAQRSENVSGGRGSGVFFGCCCFCASSLLQTLAGFS